MKTPEATNYLCEAGFARCAVTTSKHVAPNMKIQLSAINPSLKDEETTPVFTLVAYEVRMNVY